MIKQFTAIVPDRLYFPEISGNKTATFTYDGPETLNVLIDKSTGIIINRSYDQSIDGEHNQETSEIIIVDCNVNTNIGYLLLNCPLTSDDYIFEPETLSDGSTYLNRVNPALHDYFSIRDYDYSEQKFKLRVIAREWKTLNLLKAENLLQYIQTAILPLITIDDGGNSAVRDMFVKKGFVVDSNPDKVVDEINNAVSVLEAYINTESLIITWKYANGYPITDFPKLPDFLQNLV